MSRIGFARLRLFLLWHFKRLNAACFHLMMTMFDPAEEDSSSKSFFYKNFFPNPLTI